MTNPKLIQAEQLTTKYEIKSQEAQTLYEQIEEKYGYPVTDNRAKNDEHAAMSMRYYVMVEDAETLRAQQIEIAMQLGDDLGDDAD